jgi:hypothetical protein
MLCGWFSSVYRLILSKRRSVRCYAEPRPRLYFAAVQLVACGSLASFFYCYTLQPAVSCFSFKVQTPPLQCLWYVSLMFANSFGIKGFGPFPITFGC